MNNFAFTQCMCVCLYTCMMNTYIPSSTIKSMVKLQENGMFFFFLVFMTLKFKYKN